jgi:peptide subunit release factor 1 (eRF1)
LVSEERLRLLTTVLDEIEAEHDFFEHVPGRQRQGGWSAFKYQRDRERHIQENFVRVVAELKQLDKDFPFKWLVIGGAGDATSAVVSLLPKALRGKLAGTFREEQFETDTKVVRQGALLAEKAERGEELRLAEEIRDRAMAGGQAALGWDETLQTLADGRVHRLAIAANSLRSERVDRALDLAAETSAGVEVVRGEAEEVLAPNGGIGALLRY